MAFRRRHPAVHPRRRPPGAARSKVWCGVVAGGVLGGSGGWARVKSGFVLPILHPTPMDATEKQRSSSMHGTSWLQSSVLAVGLDVAPAAPVG